MQQCKNTVLLSLFCSQKVLCLGLHELCSRTQFRYIIRFSQYALYSKSRIVVGRAGRFSLPFLRLSCGRVAGNNRRLHCGDFSLTVNATNDRVLNCQLASYLWPSLLRVAERAGTHDILCFWEQHSEKRKQTHSWVAHRSFSVSEHRSLPPLHY